MESTGFVKYFSFIIYGILGAKVIVIFKTA